MIQSCAELPSRLFRQSHLPPRHGIAPPPLFSPRTFPFPLRPYMYHISRNQPPKSDITSTNHPEFTPADRYRSPRIFLSGLKHFPPPPLPYLSCHHFFLHGMVEYIQYAVAFPTLQHSRPVRKVIR